MKARFSYVLGGVVLIAVVGVAAIASARASSAADRGAASFRCTTRAQVAGVQLRLRTDHCNMPLRAVQYTFPQGETVAAVGVLRKSAVAGRATCSGSGTRQIACLAPKPVAPGPTNGVLIAVKPLPADARVTVDLRAQKGARSRVVIGVVAAPACSVRAQASSDTDTIIGVVGCHAGPVNELDLRFAQPEKADGYAVFVNGQEVGRGKCQGSGTTNLTCVLVPTLPAGDANNGAYVEVLPTCAPGSVVQIHVVASARSTQDLSQTCT